MAWWKTAKPGDPVVCIDGVPGCREVQEIMTGRVYLLREVFICNERYNDPGAVGVLLDGLTGNIWNGCDESAYHAYRFRPAQSTDLPEELTQLLDQPVSEELKVGA